MRTIPISSNEIICHIVKTCYLTTFFVRNMKCWSNKRIYVRCQEQLLNYRDSAFVLGGLKAFNFFAFFCFVALAPDWKAFQLSTLDCRDSSKFFCHSRSNAACASADSSSSRFLLRCSASLVANSLLQKKKNHKLLFTDNRINFINYIIIIQINLLLSMSAKSFIVITQTACL